jgi:hypothetical protein
LPACNYDGGKDMVLGCMGNDMGDGMGFRHWK